MAATVGRYAFFGMTELRESDYLAAAFFRRLHAEDDDGKIIYPIASKVQRQMYECKQPT